MAFDHIQRQLRLPTPVICCNKPARTGERVLPQACPISDIESTTFCVLLAAVSKEQMLHILLGTAVIKQELLFKDISQDCAIPGCPACKTANKYNERRERKSCMNGKFSVDISVSGWTLLRRNVLTWLPR